MSDPLQIIDISSNNSQPWDFAAVKASGVTGVIIKATEGVGYVDPFLVDAWKAAKAAGLWVGGYHFAHPGTNSAEAEAAHFVATIGPLLEPGDGAALDIEVEGTASTNAFSLALAAAVAKALGFPPMVYSYPDFIQHWLTDKGLGAYPLWLASLTNVCPPSMGPWPYVTLWQNTWTANVPGIPGQVDRSVIARDLAGLKALGKPAPVVPKPSNAYHVGKPGGLKTEANHGSKDAIDARHRPVFLEVGAQVRTTGLEVVDPVTKEVWAEVKLVQPENTVHGYFLKASLAAN